MANKVTALAGGVGGAKLADGLAQVLPPSDLTVIVNTGDDFRYLGLAICPDLDTVCYNLAGLENPVTGWGRRDETWNVLSTLTDLGGDNWFQLGDRDLATHLARTANLQQGIPLSEITRRFCAKWGVNCTVLPMTDQSVSTKLETASGECLDFQEYFVHQRWQPEVRRIHFAGVTDSRPAPGVLEAIQAADVVVICPSNPLVSVDPILSVPGIREAVLQKAVVAVSPIVGGAAIKGPLAKMIEELYQEPPSAEWVAGYYQQTLKLDGFILDEIDRQSLPMLRSRGIICEAVPSIMKSREERLQLAEMVMNYCEHWVNR